MINVLRVDGRRSWYVPIIIAQTMHISICNFSSCLQIAKTPGCMSLIFADPTA